MQYQGINDDHLPIVVKEPLRQYDNYQRHDLICEDIIYSAIGNNTPPPVKFRNFLAIERTSLIGEIECDFTAIALMYP